MNLKRIIDKNNKLILYVIIIVVLLFIAIKGLNAYYEEDEKQKREASNNTIGNNITQSSGENTQEGQVGEVDNYTTDNSNTIENTMETFINYCNNKELEKAYEMLTNECKSAMFPTLQDFQNVYIKNIFDSKKEYELIIWSTDGNKSTYQVKLYGDMLATGTVEGNSTQDYYTFVKCDDGTYKLNINNYIYGEDRNKEYEEKNIVVKIGHIDVYDEYEEIEISVTNNSSKQICLTGNKYNGNIYLQNSKGTTYSSLNSKFDNEEIIIYPNSMQNFIVKFNKGYNAGNKATEIVFSDIILDYEEYLESESKTEYTKRTKIKVKY